MNFSLRLPCLGLPLIFIFLGLSNENHGFMQTSSLLAWSNAPGASLEELSTQVSLQDDFFNSPAQLPFVRTSRPLCPSGPSSLLIFTLSSSAQRSNLKNGFLSSRLKQEFNSAPALSRFRTNNFPNSLADLWTSELPSAWTSLCQGEVILREITDEDIDTVFDETIRRINDPRLVIFTTPTLMSRSSVSNKEKTNNQKRHLSQTITENATSNSRGMPSSKTGVFWRYSFLSDYLIIGILVMVLLFIPPVMLGSFALQSIESPQGLKTKMVGQVSEVKAN